MAKSRAVKRGNKSDKSAENVLENRFISINDYEIKDNLKQQAALAVAANQAESVIKSVFSKFSSTWGMNDYTKVIKNFNVWLQACEGSIIQVPSTETAITNGLLHLWNMIALNLPDKRQHYQTDAQRQHDIILLLLQINKLRNYFSHMSRLDDPFTGDNTKRPLANFLMTLYNDVSTSRSLKQRFNLVENNTLNAIWGSVFVLNLFLPKSQANFLIQQVSQGSLNRREQQLFSFYSLRDRYSLTQLYSQDNLFREILNYLTLAPIDSKIGQDNLRKWQQSTDEEKSICSPIFRSRDKIRYYLHAALDELGLLTEMTFWGSNKRQHAILNAGEEVDETEKMATLVLIDEASLNTVKQVCHDKTVEKTGVIENKKIVHDKKYGRNTLRNDNQLFVYDMSDGNIRFCLVCPEKEKEKPALNGVIRLRDFINLAFYTLTAPRKVPDILLAMYKWLEDYQHILTTNTDWQANITKENLRTFPKQIQQHAMSQPAPDLTSRLKKRITVRRERISQLIKKDKTAPFNNVSNQGKNYRHYLPRHEQVHEILHYFIANLNKEGRKKVTKHEFVKLQKLLLQYKGDRDDSIIRNIEQSVPTSVKDEHLSDTASFWQYLYEKYLPCDVIGNRNHPLWDFAISKSRDKKHAAVTSLGNLCQQVLYKQRDDLNALEKQLNNSNRQLTDEELEAFAIRLQLPLKHNARNQPQEGVGRLQAAAHRARLYSVIPTGFIQTTLNLKFTDLSSKSIGSGSEKAENLARIIRQYDKTKLKLNDYYQVADLYPQLEQNIALHTGTLNGLASQDKKRWKQAIKVLNDWYTHDKLCLIMTEALAKKANITLPQGRAVTEYSFVQPVISIKGINPCGQEVELSLQLNDTHQPTRLWFTSWPMEKINRVLCLHYAKDSQITAKEIPKLITAYQNHYQQIIEKVLNFEKQFIQHKPEKWQELKAIANDKGYIAFVDIIKQLSQMEFNESDKICMKKLRNTALHNGSISGAFKKKDDYEYLLHLIPQTDTVVVTEIGAALLNKLSNIFPAS